MGFRLRSRMIFGVAVLLSATAWLGFEYLLARYPAIEYGIGVVALLTFGGCYFTVWRAARREQAFRDEAGRVPHLDAARVDGHVYDLRSSTSRNHDRAV